MTDTTTDDSAEGLNIGLLLFDDVEELDFVGPWEVLTVAAMTGKKPRPNVFTLAEGEGPIRCAKGMRVLPDKTLADAPPLDVLIVPGGEGTRREMGNEALISWIRQQAVSCQWIASVCTGSFLLHKAGLTTDKTVTTHWAFTGALETLGATVDAESRWVADGRLITAAGVSAGIDMALWLVGQLYDADKARNVQRWIQYDPAPPFADASAESADAA